jgi:hypothetical protein
VEMLEEFPTTLAEDEEMLEELESVMAASASEAPATGGEKGRKEEEEEEEGEGEEEEEEEEEDTEGVSQYLTAVRYRITVKRMLDDFVKGSLAIGIEPSE